MRARVLAEEPVCPGYRIARCGKPTTDVDHIVGLLDGGARLARENLRAWCHGCHARRTHDEVKARR